MGDALIHSFIFDAKGRARPASLDDVRAWRPGGGERLWVHLDVSHPDTRAWLEKEAGLPPLVADALLAEETRPRSSIIQDALLIFLRGVNLNPGADPEDMVSIRLWVEQDRVISTRRRQLLSVLDTVESLAAQPLEGTGDLLLRIIMRMVDRINDVVDDLEIQVADLEQDVLEEPAPVMRARLADLRRESISLKRYLAPQRDALMRLPSEAPAWIGDRDKLHLREISDRMVRLVEDIDTVRELAAVVNEELVSMLSDQLNKRMYLLSIVAALFLPLGFLTGLLGINVGGIPGADNPSAFWLFSGALVCILAVQVFFLSRRKWF
ncbi:MAG: zinc transporter ZntB [Gammaproteobacteria bacterium]